MKTLKFYGLFFLSIIILLFQSCENITENQTSKVEFGVSLDKGQLKSLSELPPDTTDVYYSWHLLLSVEDENGQPVMEDEIVPLLAFGDGFVSGKIEMNVGSYFLTKFMVINPEGTVLYAAPLEGSPKAQFVDRPLPLNFKIVPGDVTRVVPQVIPVDNSHPSDFGYVAFGFEVVNPIAAYVVAVDDNPLYMRPSMMIPARMTIFTPEGRMWEYKLEPRINKILIKPGYDYYHVMIENPDFPPLEMELSARELKNSSPNDPIVFNLSKENYDVLILQPGPEYGKDAMITDLDPQENFGFYEYFEASFMTEPVLTVMRTKRSLIHFNLTGLPRNARIKEVTLVLHFEQPLWDSIYVSELDDFMVWNDTLVFQQIIEPWNEHEVNWENQPQTIPANQVLVPLNPHLSTNQRSFDVTSLFVPYQEIAAPNHGFMFKQLDDYNPAPGGMQFVSSDYPIKEMRPKLIVKYKIY